MAPPSVPLLSERCIPPASLYDEPVSLDHAGLTPPLILKPSVACGLPQSHGMALVTAPGGDVVVAALQVRGKVER